MLLTLFNRYAPIPKTSVIKGDNRIILAPHNPNPQQVIQQVQVIGAAKAPLKAIIIPPKNRDTFRREADALSEDEKKAISGNINNSDWIKNNASPFIQSQFARIQHFIKAAKKHKKERFSAAAFMAACGEKTTHQKLHTDPFTIHLSVTGAPLQFMIGGDGKSYDEDDPNVMSNIRNAQQGDLVVFDQHFPHRSSCYTPKQGQFSIAHFRANPYA